jgi:hypothetical protein
MNLTDVTEHFRKRGYPGCGVCGGKFHISDMWIDAELYYEHGQWVIELQYDQSAYITYYDDLEEAVEHLDGEFYDNSED